MVAWRLYGGIFLIVLLTGLSYLIRALASVFWCDLLVYMAYAVVIASYCAAALNDAERKAGKEYLPDSWYRLLSFLFPYLHRRDYAFLSPEGVDANVIFNRHHC